MVKSKIKPSHTLVRPGLCLAGALVFGFSLLTFSLSPFFVSAAPPPTLITYQGKLLVNSLAATTTQSIAFTLYDAATGGNALYTAAGTLAASSTISVTPSNGLFSVDLGGTGTNSLSPDIFQNNQSVYLEIRVSSQVLSPRKQITASPFAYNTKYLDGVAATSTASSSTYIPVSDARGNFSFNNVTSTKLTAVQSGGSQYFSVSHDGSNVIATTTIGAFSFNSLLQFASGTAITDSVYQIGRDADATNQLHFNVPTGAGYEWSIADAAKMAMTSAGDLIFGSSFGSSRVTVNEGATDGASRRGGTFVIAPNPTSDTSADYVGVRGQVSRGITDTINFTGSFSGGQFTGTNSGQNSTVTTVQGLDALASTFQGVTTNLYGAVARVSLGASSPTVTNAYGLQTRASLSSGSVTEVTGIHAQAFSGSVAPTRSYGLRVDSPGLGTTQWTLAAESGNSYIAGSLIIGTSSTAPGYNLSVSGTAAFGQFTGTGLAITSAAGGSNTVTTSLTLSTTSTNAGNALVFDTNRTIASSTAALYSWRNNGFRLMSLSSSGTLEVYGAISAMTATLGTPGAPGDLAERVDITSDETIEPGDIMMVDPNHPDTYRRAARPHPALSSVEERDNSHIPIAGVISTNPTIVVGNGKTEHTAVLALIGRVPVKASLEHGPIKAGDPLTLGSISGVATKATEAGTIIGFALEDFSGYTAENRGRVLILLRPTWWSPFDLAHSALSSWPKGQSSTPSMVEGWSPGLGLGTATPSEPASERSAIREFFQELLATLRDLGIIIEEGVIRVRELVADRIQSKELCVEDICVTRVEWKQLLEKNQLLPTAPSASPLSAPESSLLVESENRPGGSATSTPTPAEDFSTPESRAPSSTAATP